jgi:hypothetical protein
MKRAIVFLLAAIAATAAAAQTADVLAGAKLARLNDHAPHAVTPLSVTPAVLFQFDVEVFSTLKGSGIIGSLDTEIAVSGPAGDFTQATNGGSYDAVTGSDTIFLSIPEPVLRVAGRYAVTVCAAGETGVRSIGPAFFDVVPRQQPEPPTPNPQPMSSAAPGAAKGAQS